MIWPTAVFGGVRRIIPAVMSFQVSMLEQRLGDADRFVHEVHELLPQVGLGVVASQGVRELLRQGCLADALDLDGRQGRGAVDSVKLVGHGRLLGHFVGVASGVTDAAKAFFTCSWLRIQSLTCAFTLAL